MFGTKLTKEQEDLLKFINRETLICDGCEERFWMWQLYFTMTPEYKVMCKKCRREYEKYWKKEKPKFRKVYTEKPPPKVHIILNPE